MANQREKTYQQIGTVTFRKTRSNKYIRLSIRTDGRVLISLPTRVSWRDAESFLQKKFDWVIEQKQKLSQTLHEEQQIPVLLPPADQLRQAQQLIYNRLDELAVQFRFRYRKAVFRNQKTLWGSCSHDNNISLNINLIHLPPHLVDYVLLHELVHTKIKNHSPRYWQALDKCFGATGAGKRLKKELNSFRPGYRCA